MLDENRINLRRNSFANFSDAAAICDFIKSMTGEQYTVENDLHLGFTVVGEKTIMASHQRDDEYSRDCLVYRQALRGFIPHYAEIATGALLVVWPETAFKWILSLLDIQLIPEWLNRPLWGELVTLAGYALALYGFRFVYSYFATSLCFEVDSIMLKRGIIARDQVQIRYADIKTTNIKQSVLDRLLGIGTLNLDSAGTNGAVDIEFHNLINPISMRQRVQRLMGKNVKN